MAATYGDIQQWSAGKEADRVPSFDTICQFVGIPAYLEIGKYGLCEDCGYGAVDRGEYVAPEHQPTLILVHCADDEKVRCMRCAAAHFGDPDSAQGESPSGS